MVSLFFHWFVVFYKSIKNKNWTQMALLFCRFFFFFIRTHHTHLHTRSSSSTIASHRHSAVSHFTHSTNGRWREICKKKKSNKNRPRDERERKRTLKFIKSQKRMEGRWENKTIKKQFRSTTCYEFSPCPCPGFVGGWSTKVTTKNFFLFFFFFWRKKIVRSRIMFNDVGFGCTKKFKSIANRARELFVQETSFRQWQI